MFLLPVGVLEAADSTNPVPELNREFRGVWVATVANIDWPSTNSLSTEAQKEELIAILDRTKKLNLNAVIFQVRPACDALYASEIEPWSEYLTGKQGRAPEPFYDPLKLAVEESHKRGLELHVWLNPYRAKHPTSKSELAPNHVSKKHPEMIVEYGDHLWMDPGLKSVQDYSLTVVNDIVKRYDIDGLHFDDYFYPYPEKNGSGETIDFPDDKSWKIYQESGGKLERADWRRENVNTLIERIYKSIKTTKPWVKFGVSPFGIWQPGFPETVSGFNPFEKLYCDSRKWLTNGWCDYFAPQLYWKIEQTAQSYPILLEWWAEQNPLNRNLWVGNYTSKVGDGWQPEELVNQIKITRDQPGASGNIHFSMKPLMRNKGNVADVLLTNVYEEPAIIPTYPWLNDKAVAKPTLNVKSQKGVMTLSWGSKEENLGQWVLQTCTHGKWAAHVLAPTQLSHTLTTNELSPMLPEVVAVTAVNRYGTASVPAIVKNNP